ncbi:MAG: enoyl-CoA hydratase/isomerase family protein [Rhodoferax sp.]
MTEHVVAQVCGRVGCLTLNRAQALNALSLDMIRSLTRHLLAWQTDPAIEAVAIRGSNKHGVFGGFCAGGDIRFFHQAALAGNPALDDFFTEEYSLNHLIHHYGKPYIAFMDGVVMGGGMGISQGASHRLVTERSKLAMPETNIGLFPDVGGGYFLSRCPGHAGEWLALSGEVISADQACAWGLADHVLPSERLAAAWDALLALPRIDAAALESWIAMFSIAKGQDSTRANAHFDAMNAVFGLDSVGAMVRALEAMPGEWAAHTLAVLRKRSPLMLHVVLEQVRRARGMGLADDLRMERDLVRHCFWTAHLERSGAHSETVEGVRALAVDKDHSPRWNPARIEDVTPDMVAPFFTSPWPAFAHPLRHLN